MTSKKTIPLHTLIFDMSSSDYHGTPNTYSSSQMKDAMKSPDLFHAKYIKKTIPKKTSSVFDLGTYVHSGTLEPENLDKDCAVFKGKVRNGDKWEAFKKLHDGKAIITEKEKILADKLIEIINSSKEAQNYIKKGKPEVSIFVKIAVVGNDIYAVKQNLILSKFGWKPTGLTEGKLKSRIADGVILILKVRADSLGIGHGFVFDVKTTSGDATDEEVMSQKINEWDYELSAAFYLDMFTAGTGDLYDKFVWLFASKSDLNCSCHMDMSTNNELIVAGRVMYMIALRNIAKGITTNWKKEEKMGALTLSFSKRKYLERE